MRDDLQALGLSLAPLAFPHATDAGIVTLQHRKDITAGLLQVGRCGGRQIRLKIDDARTEGETPALRVPITDLRNPTDPNPILAPMETMSVGFEFQFIAARIGRGNRQNDAVGYEIVARPELENGGQIDTVLPGS